MTYYVLNSDNQIILVDEDLKRLQTTTKLPIHKTSENEAIYNGQLVSIEKANELKEEERKEKRKAEILAEIEKLDLQRIRAIAEPSQKDEEQTWLEYYTEQIVALRGELKDA